jgi:hypothetical protein
MTNTDRPPEDALPTRAQWLAALDRALTPACKQNEREPLAKLTSSEANA